MLKKVGKRSESSFTQVLCFFLNLCIGLDVLPLLGDGHVVALPPLDPLPEADLAALEGLHLFSTSNPAVRRN